MIRRLVIAPLIVATCAVWGAASLVYVYAGRVRGMSWICYLLSCSVWLCSL